MDDKQKEWYDSVVRAFATRGMVAPNFDQIKKYYDRGFEGEDVFETLDSKSGSTIDSNQQVDDVDPSSLGTELAAVSQRDYTPHLTEKDVLAKVKNKTFHTLGAGITTVCEITMLNGHVAHGSFSPVAGEMVSEQIARAKALLDAIRNVWALEAYLVRENLYRADVAAQPADSTEVVLR